MIFIDFFENTIGLHVNGKAEVVKNDEILQNDNLTEGILHDIQDRSDKRLVLMLDAGEFHEVYFPIT